LLGKEMCRGGKVMSGCRQSPLSLCRCKEGPFASFGGCYHGLLPRLYCRNMREGMRRGRLFTFWGFDDFFRKKKKVVSIRGVRKMFQVSLSPF
jgi:hypothetical protein